MRHEQGERIEWNERVERNERFERNEWGDGRVDGWRNELSLGDGQWQRIIASGVSRTALAFIAGLALFAIASAVPTTSADEPSAELVALLKTFRTEFVEIKPGEKPYPATFRMGSAQVGAVAEPVREVKMSKPFWFAKYEVPQNLWQAVMGENPSRWKGPRNSAEMFTWEESVEFCRRATEAMRTAKLIGADETIRLPSEAEWEYCARAGTATEYSFGDDVGQLGQYGWFTGNAAGNDPPVGAKKPNAWGLYDMHGYLSEWCADTWHDSYEGAPADGSAWTAGGDPGKRVLRSGSWKDKAEALRSAARRSADARLRDDAVGLRCVLSKK